MTLVIRQWRKSALSADSVAPGPKPYSS